MDLQELLTRATAPESSPLPMPRCALVFAHPDDETVALGARFARFGAAHLVHATDGAPRNGEDSRHHGFASVDDYRRARAEELTRMIETAGVSSMLRTSLDIPDQEAALQLEMLTCRVYRILAEFQPDVVLTHPYEGGHPDHDACAFAVHLAVKLLQSRDEPLTSRVEKPVIVEAAFYRAGPQGAAAGEFLPSAPADAQSTALIEHPLSPSEQQKKQELLNCFTTQMETLKGFPLHVERFRLAPQYNFRNPPHAGTVLYERFPWGMEAARFCRLARQTEDALLDHREN